MTSVPEPQNGYRAVQADHDTNRWRRVLFGTLRRSPAYRSAVKGMNPSDYQAISDISSADPDYIGRESWPPGYWLDDPVETEGMLAIERVAIALRLTQDGRPCPWAIDLIRDDLAGRFDADRPPTVIANARKRELVISASLASMHVSTYRHGKRETRLASNHHQPENPGQLSQADWDKLEALAVKAAREAVRSLREDFLNPVGPVAYHHGRVSAGKEGAKRLKVERLALRLAGQAGERNDRRTDRDYCERLGIDMPGEK